MSEAYPVYSAEVDRLGKVKALVEAAVIRSRKRDDKLSSTLVCSVNLKQRDVQSVARLNRQQRIVSAVSFIFTGTP